MTGLSDRDPLHKLPVVEQLEAALYTDALVTLAPSRAPSRRSSRPPGC
ncbi:hypothetical protein OG800_19185 [Streptomyces sp. NBC_00445]